jgi:hypothetical protein
MYTDRDGGWFGAALIGGAPLRDTERRQAVGVFSFVGGRPLTEVVTAVQPKGGGGQKLIPPGTLN